MENEVYYGEAVFIIVLFHSNHGENGDMPVPSLE